AAEKEERATATGASRRSAEADDRRSATATERSSPKPTTNGGATQGLAQRRAPYLIAVRQPTGFAAWPSRSIDAVVDYLGRQEDVEIVPHDKEKTAKDQPFFADDPFAQEIAVARVPESKAEALRISGQPNIVVERDTRIAAADGLHLPSD